jgi:hypothetical protein
MRVPSVLVVVVDVILTLFLMLSCGILMSILLFVAIVTEETLRLLQAYTLRPYEYINLKLGLLRRGE